MFCDFSWGDMNKCVFTSDEALMADQKKWFHPTVAQWASEFTGATYRSTGEGLLTGAWVTQSQLYLCKHIPAWMMTHESYIPGASWTICWLLSLQLFTAFSTLGKESCKFLSSQSLRNFLIFLNLVNYLSFPPLSRRQYFKLEVIITQYCKELLFNPDNKIDANIF